MTKKILHILKVILVDFAFKKVLVEFVFCSCLLGKGVKRRRTNINTVNPLELAENDYDFITPDKAKERNLPNHPHYHLWSNWD